MEPWWEGRSRVWFIAEAIRKVQATCLVGGALVQQFKRGCRLRLITTHMLPAKHPRPRAALSDSGSFGFKQIGSQGVKRGGDQRMIVD
jgi:hypothetical protein